MASLNLVDYDRTVSTYEAVVAGELNWLSLTYSDSNQPDDLSLTGSGSGGLAELKSCHDNPTRPFIAFFRDQVPNHTGFVIINYLPSSISAVRRARISVHSRRVGAVFKIEHATLTVDHLANLTPTAAHQAVLNPDSVHVIQSDHPVDTGTGAGDMPVTPTAKPVRRSFTEIYAPDVTPPGAIAKSTSMFTNILRRKPLPKEVDVQRALPILQEQAPPPTPPKDRRPTIATTTPTKALPPLQPNRRNSLGGFAIVPNHLSSDDDEDMVVVSPQPSNFVPSYVSVPLPPKWHAESLIVADPEERIRRRQLAQQQREKAEQEAIEEEAERQRQLKLKKNAQLQREMEEEAERRASIEQEIKRAAAERRRKEEEERLLEEEKKREREARKLEEKARRTEEHQRLQAWRKEQSAAAELAARHEAEAQQQESLDRKKRIQTAKAQAKQGNIDETGWVTLQTSESLVWRRRFFKFIGGKAFFYRSAKDMNQALDELELRGHVRAVRDWYEGYEELKAIPFSFAIEFKDDRGSWAMFTDSEEDKFRLLGLLCYHAGI